MQFLVLVLLNVQQKHGFSKKVEVLCVIRKQLFQFGKHKLCQQRWEIHYFLIVCPFFHHQAPNDRSPRSGQQMGEEHGEREQAVCDQAYRWRLHEELRELYHVW